MRAHIKSITLGVACCTIISFLLGVLVSVPLWIALLRSFLSGAVFFLLLTAAFYTIKRFLPELLQEHDPFAEKTAAESVIDTAAATEDTADKKEEKGKVVNTVVGNTTDGKEIENEMMNNVHEEKAGMKTPSEPGPILASSDMPRSKAPALRGNTPAKLARAIQTIMKR